jgi:hypothetical protein
MTTTPTNSYKLYRVMLNSLGDGIGCTGHEVYHSLEDAQDAVTRRWAADNCKNSVEWKAVNQYSGKTVASKRAA